MRVCAASERGKPYSTSLRLRMPSSHYNMPTPALVGDLGIQRVPTPYKAACQELSPSENPLYPTIVSFSLGGDMMVEVNLDQWQC